MAIKARFGNPFEKRTRRAKDRRMHLEKQRFLRGEVGATVRKVGLSKIAQTIIEAKDLPASPRGKSILRLGLQTVLLRKIIEGRKGARRIFTSNDKACLELIKETEKVHSAVWAYQRRKLDFKEAAETHKAAAEILKKAQAAFKGNAEYNQGQLRDMEKRARGNAKQIESIIALGGVGSVSQINHKELLRTAQMGEKMIEMLSKKLPEDSKIGFELIEKMVEEKLGGQQ